MSHGVAANTRLAGAAQGNFLDDLTNRMSFQHQIPSCCYNICSRILANVGQWPKDQAIRRISKIVVYTGAIIDSVRITYEMTSGEPITVQHGGDGGAESLNFELTGNFHFNFGSSKFTHCRNYRKPKTHRCLWSPAR